MLSCTAGVSPSPPTDSPRLAFSLTLLQAPIECDRFYSYAWWHTWFLFALASPAAAAAAACAAPLANGRWRHAPLHELRSDSSLPSSPHPLPSSTPPQVLVVPVFLAAGWVHKWRVGLIGLLAVMVTLLQYTW